MLVFDWLAVRHAKQPPRLNSHDRATPGAPQELEVAAPGGGGVGGACDQGLWF